MILINIYKINLIINIGSCGGLNASLNVGDTIIPKKICYYDVDLTNFGYQKGQIPKYPAKFSMQKNIHKFLQNISKKFHLKFKTGLMISGDSFIGTDILMKMLKIKFSSSIAVEMESGAISQICYKFHIPFIIIKSVSDCSDQNAALNFNKNIDFASLQSCAFVKIILENIKNI